MTLSADLVTDGLHERMQTIMRANGMGHPEFEFLSAVQSRISALERDLSLANDANGTIEAALLEEKQKNVKLIAFARKIDDHNDELQERVVELERENAELRSIFTAEDHFDKLPHEPRADLITLAIQTIEGLAEQQASHDGWYQRALDTLKAHVACKSPETKPAEPSDVLNALKGLYAELSGRFASEADMSADLRRVMIPAREALARLESKQFETGDSRG